MKVLPHEISVESRLVLSKRELQLLHHVFSYDLKPESVVSTHYAGGVTAKEIDAFSVDMRIELKRLMDRIEDSKTKLFQNP